MTFELELDEENGHRAMSLQHRRVSDTTFWRGEYENNAALRAEFFSVCGEHV